MEEDLFAEDESKPKRRKKKSHGILIAVLAAVILLAAAAGLFFFIMKDMLAYNKAETWLDEGRYEEAKAVYTALGDYEDSSEKAKLCDYRNACALFAAGKTEEAEALFTSLGSFYDSAAWAENCRGAIRKKDYAAAEALLTVGDYEAAKAAYLALGDYEDAAEKALECDYRVACGLLENGDYAGARELFAALNGYSDSAAMLQECDYRNALALIESGSMEAAADILAALPGYKDADELLASITGEEETEETPEEALLEEDEEEAHEYDGSDWQPGQIITFGNYMQQENSRERTPIEWLVLERDGDKVLLLSRYGLDAQQYYTKLRAVTWENCSLRTWLNDEFIYKAFTAAENGAIVKTQVDNSRTQAVTNTLSGNDTEDKLFLLSSAEVEKYFPDKADRTCLPTAYAAGNGAYNKAKNGNTWWWTRSPGNTQNTVDAVNFDGKSCHYGVSQKSGAVRPAMWVDITKLP